MLKRCLKRRRKCSSHVIQCRDIGTSGKHIGSAYDTFRPTSIRSFNFIVSVFTTTLGLSWFAMITTIVTTVEKKMFINVIGSTANKGKNTRPRMLIVQCEDTAVCGFRSVVTKHNSSLLRAHFSGITLPSTQLGYLIRVNSISKVMTAFLFLFCSIWIVPNTLTARKKQYQRLCHNSKTKTRRITCYKQNWEKYSPNGHAIA